MTAAKDIRSASRTVEINDWVQDSDETLMERVTSEAIADLERDGGRALRIEVRVLGEDS